MDRETIVRALDERRVLQIRYGGGESRTIQPHAILRKGDGTELLEAYQVRGHTVGGHDYGWKNFDLTRIDSVEVMSEQFEPRRDFRPRSSESGQLMAQVRVEEPPAA